MAGDQYILSTIPGTVIFVTGGFLQGTIWYFLAATTAGKWYLVNSAGYSNITPTTYGTFTGYTANTVITATWNGNVVFINDMINPPMYYIVGYGTLALYDYPDPVSGQTYVWNYDVGISTITGNTTPLYSSLTGGFIRVYNSPNVGSLLISGN